MRFAHRVLVNGASNLRCRLRPMGFARFRKEKKMPEWQPIETAPEGCEIIVASEHGVHTARAFSGFWFIQAAGREPHTLYDDPYCVNYPTHWMPLPDAPKSQEAPAPAQQAAGDK